MPHNLGGARIVFIREHLLSHRHFRFPDARRSSSNFPLGQPAQALRKLHKSCFLEFRGQGVQQFQKHSPVIRHSLHSLALAAIAEFLPADDHRPPIFTLGKRQHVIIGKAHPLPDFIGDSDAPSFSLVHPPSIAVGLAGAVLTVELTGDSIQRTVVTVPVADIILGAVRRVNDDFALSGAHLNDALGADTSLQKHLQRHGHQNKWFACQNNHILYFKLHLCWLCIFPLEQVIVADEQFLELLPGFIPLGHGVDSGEIINGKSIVQLPYF